MALKNPLPACQALGQACVDILIAMAAPLRRPFLCGMYNSEWLGNKWNGCITPMGAPHNVPHRRRSHHNHLLLGPWLRRLADTGSMQRGKSIPQILDGCDRRSGGFIYVAAQSWDAQCPQPLGIAMASSEISGRGGGGPLRQPIYRNAVHLSFDPPLPIICGSRLTALCFLLGPLRHALASIRRRPSSGKDLASGVRCSQMLVMEVPLQMPEWTCNPQTAMIANIETHTGQR